MRASCSRARRSRPPWLRGSSRRSPAPVSRRPPRAYESWDTPAHRAVICCAARRDAPRDPRRGAHLGPRVQGYTCSRLSSEFRGASRRYAIVSPRTSRASVCGQSHLVITTEAVGAGGVALRSVARGAEPWTAGAPRAPSGRAARMRTGRVSEAQCRPSPPPVADNDGAACTAGSRQRRGNKRRRPPPPAAGSRKRQGTSGTKRRDPSSESRGPWVC